MSGTDASRIGLVGPAFPEKGGIVRHTAELATYLHATHRLAAFAPWERYRPRLLARRVGRLDAPEVTVDVPTLRGPRWDVPGSWRRTGEDIAQVADRLLLVLSSPAQLPALLMMRAAFLTRNQAGRVGLVVHNVVPHDAGPLGRGLARLVVRSGLRLLVHTPSQAELAISLGADSGAVQVARLPYHGPALREVPWNERAASTAPRVDTGLRLVFLGFVRPYKGIATLLEALVISKRPHRLLIMGEFWESPTRFRRRIAALGLESRVELCPGYAGDAAVQQALTASDALVLPYLAGTASQLPRIAFKAGVPVIATDVGDLADQVRHEGDGLIVPPGDPQKLAAALDRASEPGRLHAFRANVRPPDVEQEWRAYLSAIESLFEPGI